MANNNSSNSTNTHTSNTKKGEYIDPDLLLADMPAIPPFNSTTLPQIRMFINMRKGEGPVEGVVKKNLFIPGPASSPDVPVVTYTPTTTTTTTTTAKPVPTIVWFHGGGYIIGNAAMDDDLLNDICKNVGAVVVAVNYRLAPENPYPAAVEDAYATLKWLYDNAETLRVDTNKIAVGGLSAGGGLAAALTLLVRDRAQYNIVYQVLVFPMLDDRTAKRVLTSQHKLWNAESNIYGWQSLLGKVEIGSDDVSPYAAAARAKSLEGLPPAFIPVGGIDLFLDENIAYAQRLMAAGVPTELHVIPGAFHGFPMMKNARITIALNAHIIALLKRVFYG